MEPSENDKWLEKAISRAAPTDKPVANFEKWRQEHPEAIQVLKSQGDQSALPRDKTVMAIQIWRTIMKSKVARLAAAAVIIIAVFLGLNFIGGPDMSTVAWGELVERLERSHDEYLGELLLAVEEKDTEKINYYADLLDEFWQKLNWLARAELHPEGRAQMLAEIARARYDHREESDQIGIQTFLAYADQFSDWLGKIEDVTWINETIHVCKQMEEYAEEIRDADSLSYVEHCMPSFLAYSGWFKQLPWDDTGEHVGPDILLGAIERDVEVARREILYPYPENRDADRFVKRCVQQAQKNALELRKKVEEREMPNEDQVETCGKLNQWIRHISKLVTYAELASWDIGQREKVESDEAFRRLLKRDFGGRGALGDLLVKEIKESLDLCAKLREEVGCGKR